LPCHGLTLDIFHDKSGKRYEMGRGLRIHGDGWEVAARENPCRLQVKTTAP
jgi:hypothetical protein